MAGKKAPAEELYDVRSQQSGAGVVIGVSLDLATSEAKRLNREARRLNGRGEACGMHLGAVTVYEVVSRSGVVVT